MASDTSDPSSTSLRQRTHDTPTTPSTQSHTHAQTPRSPKPAATSTSTSHSSTSSSTALPILVDALRFLVLLVLLGSVFSYFISNSSLTFGYRPAWTRSGPLKTKLFGPVTLTPAQLALYNGSDPTLPIYVAVNGSVYDVSASPRFYGPGGSYSFFAGRDAARAFVTGCFDTDLNADLRGVEEMFVPEGEPGEPNEPSEQNGNGEHGEHGQDEFVQGGQDQPEPGKSSKPTTAETKIQREQEYRVARTKVREAIEHWQRFFEKNDKYWKVGIVQRDPGWLENEPVKPLCEAARRMRPKREGN